MNCFSSIAAALSIALVSISLPIQSAHATPSYRGFQIDGGISDTEIATLKNEYRANIVRIQVGDNQLMDFVTGQEYVAMMERTFNILDPVFTRLHNQGIKVVFALYSPPGGFASRQSPSHYRMFSDAALQPEFIDMWLRIMNRYKDNPAIYAFDILNEPAMRQSELGAGAKNWNTLLLETIAAIRTVAPTKLLMVKSLYGDPSKLTSLPEIRDTNIIFSYHPYVFLSYQQSGIGGLSTDQPAPDRARIESKLLGLLGKFYFKHFKRYKAKKVPTQFPVINAGEIAVSGAALDSGVFMNSLLDVLDNGKGTAAYKKALKKLKKNRKGTGLSFKDFTALVTHQSWTIHAYDEAKIWDPRYQCTSESSCTFAGSTDRDVVIKGFMSKN